MKLSGILNFVQGSNSLSHTQIVKQYKFLETGSDGSKLDRYIAANVAKNVPIDRVRLANRFLANGNLDGALNILSGKSVHYLSAHLGMPTNSLRAEFKAAFNSVSNENLLAKQTRVKQLLSLTSDPNTVRLLESVDSNAYKDLLGSRDFINKFNTRYRQKNVLPEKKITAMGVLKVTALLGGGYALLRLAGKNQNANTGCFLISLRNDFKCKLSSRSCLSSDKRKGCNNPVASQDPDQCVDDRRSACKNCFCKTPESPEGFDCQSDFKVICVEQTLVESLDELMEGVYEKASTVYEKGVEYLSIIFKWLPAVFFALVAVYIFRTIKYGGTTTAAAKTYGANV
jgi:hypothetical protein